jgi:hypothetical protein
MVFLCDAERKKTVLSVLGNQGASETSQFPHPNSAQSDHGIHLSLR